MSTNNTKLAVAIQSPSYFQTLNILFGMQRLAQAIAYSAVEDAADEGSPYCPTCSSCGETGCCPPTMCQTVICRYGKSNLKDYRVMNLQLDFLHNTLSALLGEETVNLMMNAIEGE